MEYNMIENGRRLVELRGEKTREQVAFDNGISVSSLAAYELGQRNPRDDVKCSLAEYYHVPVGDIFYPDKVHFA